MGAGFPLYLYDPSRNEQNEDSAGGKQNLTQGQVELVELLVEVEIVPQGQVEVEFELNPVEFFSQPGRGRGRTSRSSVMPMPSQPRSRNP